MKDISFTSASMNLSMGCLFCVVDDELPVFSTTEISLNLPTQGRVNVAKLNGLAVRCSPRIDGQGYDAAFMFAANGCDDGNRLLVEHMLTSLPQREHLIH